MIVKTLRESAGSLPHGVPGPQGPMRDYAFKSWTGKDEREIGALIEGGDAQKAKFVTATLAYFLTRWGGKDFADVKPEVRRLALLQAYTGDVMFAWAQLRRQVIGDTLSLDLICPACKRGFPYDLDVGSIEVLCTEDTDVILELPVLLRDGLVINGKTHKLLTTSHLRWSSHEAIAAMTNPGAINLEIAASSICGLDGHDGPVSVISRQLDDMTKYDLEVLLSASGRNAPGPTMSFAVKCPNIECGLEIARRVPWAYDDFFSLRPSSAGPLQSSG